MLVHNKGFTRAVCSPAFRRNHAQLLEGRTTNAAAPWRQILFEILDATSSLQFESILRPKHRNQIP